MAGMPGMGLAQATGSGPLTLTGRVFSYWNWGDPFMLIPILLLIVASAWLTVQEWRCRGARRKHVLWLLLAGCATLFAAGISPLGAASPMYSFTFHMIQHICFAMIAPLFLLAALRSSAVAGHWLDYSPVGKANAFLCRLWLSVPVWSILYFGWHLPPLYDFGMSSAFLHALMQFSFLVAGSWLLWGVILPLDRESYSTGHAFSSIGYLTLSCISPTLLGTMLALAPPLYEIYREMPAILGFTPLSDQRLGGVIMIGFENFFTFAICTYFFLILVRDSAGQSNQEAPADSLDTAPKLVAQAGASSAEPAAATVTSGRTATQCEAPSMTGATTATIAGADF